MVALIVVLVVIALIVLGLVVSYNRFVAQRQQVQSAWSNVDTELKRRYDLIPNLVGTVQGYAAHERGVFDEVTRARAAAQAAQGPAASSAAEGPFVAALGRLMAVAENYPQLKANENFLQLQSTLADTEDRIQQSRGYYNSVVQQFNRRIQAFPSNLIAGAFHFQQADYFEIDPSRRAVEAEPPKVDFTGVAPTAAPAAVPAGTPPAASDPAAGAGTPPPPPAG
jgi:LemA protein